MTKKRLVKRVVALAATAMMLVGMVIPAMADSTLANSGTITVHKYSGNQEGIVDNYTGSKLTGSDLPSANGFVALKDAEFTLYKVNDLKPVMDKIKAGATITKTVVVEGAPGSAPSVKYTFSDSSELTQPTTIVTMAGLTNPATTSAAGEIVFGNNNLADGVYVLVETNTPKDHYTAAPSIIRLPLTNEEGKHNYDVHVYPKNVISSDPAKKDIDGVKQPVSTNNLIDFELKAKFISDTVKNVKDLRAGEAVTGTYGAASITEKFNAYFALQTSPAVTAYWLNANGTLSTRALLPAEYQVGALTGADGDGAGGQFTVTLTQAGIDKAILGNEVGFGITLRAKYVGAPSVAQGEAANRVTNTMDAYIEAAADGPGDGTTTTDDTYLPSIAIKVENETSSGDPLGGVTFGLSKVPVPRVNLDPNKTMNDYTDQEKAWIREDYVLGLDGEPLIEVTDNDGLLIFSNLNGYDNDEGATFYLKQLETVPGFKLKIPAIEVNFKDREGYKADNPDWFDGDDWKENAYVLETVTVTNYELGEDDGEEPGFSLPLTGGAGTVAFTIAGILVMLGAAVLIVKRKKVA